MRTPETKTYPDNKHRSTEILIRWQIPVMCLALVLFLALVVNFNLIDGVTVVIFSGLSILVLINYRLYRTLAYRAIIDFGKSEVTFYMATGKKVLRVEIKDITELREGLWLSVISKEKKIKLNKHYFPGFAKDLNECMILTEG